MASVKTLPLDYELSIYTGTTFRKEFRWLPDGCTGLDFIGWHASMLLGNPGAATPLLALSDTDGITLSAGGQVIILIDPDRTAALPSGVLSYSLDLTDSAGTIQRFLRGRVNVIGDVGRST